MSVNDDKVTPVTLTGWKDIATYMGRSVRSVQRYERELGLPVRRIRTRDGQSVYALQAEIDEWRLKVDLSAGGIPDDGPDSDMVSQGSPERPDGDVDPALAERARRRWPPSRLAGMTLLIGMATGAAAVWWPRPESNPKSVRVGGGVISALDENSRLLWSHKFGRPVRSPEQRSYHNLVTDLDGDGRDEVIAAVSFTDDGRRATDTDAVVALSSTGRLLWDVRPDLSLICGQDRFTGPWQFGSIAPGGPANGGRTWVSFTHHTWWPSFVLEIETSGKSHVRYVQTGWILSLSYWKPGAADYLVAGGVNNESGQPSVVFLPARGAPSVMPSASPRFACLDMPTELPDKVILLPNLELTAAASQPYSIVRDVRPLGPELMVTLDAADGAAMVTLGASGRVSDFSLTASYGITHRVFESRGWIDHTFEVCPDRTTPKKIRVWDASGWHEYTVLPNVRDE